MITKLISGFQWGADKSIIEVCETLQLKIGGMAPKGYRGKFGNFPELKELGIVESTSDKYPPRTFDNVKNSDGTIRLAFDFTTGGEKLTLKAIESYKKPYIDINLKSITVNDINQTIKWFGDHDINVLNVAGNGGKDISQSTMITRLCTKLLTHCIKEYNNL